MIKRILYFGNPAYLGDEKFSIGNSFAYCWRQYDLPEIMKSEGGTTITIEDILIVTRANLVGLEVLLIICINGII